jgi:hypothetical protein
MALHTGAETAGGEIDVTTFYVVRALVTDPRDDRLSYRRPGPLGVNKFGKSTANTYDTFQEAQAAAMEWTNRTPSSYNPSRIFVVYEVRELGRAEPFAPPVIWRRAE